MHALAVEFGVWIRIEQQRSKTMTRRLDMKTTKEVEWKCILSSEMEKKTQFQCG